MSFGREGVKTLTLEKCPSDEKRNIKKFLYRGVSALHFALSAQYFTRLCALNVPMKRNTTLFNV